MALPPGISDFSNFINNISGVHIHFVYLIQLGVRVFAEVTESGILQLPETIVIYKANVYIIHSFSKNLPAPCSRSDFGYIFGFNLKHSHPTSAYWLILFFHVLFYFLL